MKRIASLSLFFILFLISSCKPTFKNITDSKINYLPYYQKVYEADSLFVTNNFEKSYKILDSLFKIYPPLQIPNVNEYSTYVYCSVLTGHVDNIKEKIKNGYKYGGSLSFQHPKSDSIYTIFEKNNFFTREERNAMHKQYMMQFDTVLYNKIKKMYLEDQAARVYPLDTVKMHATDAKNKKLIQEIFKKYGYPNRQLIGQLGLYDDEPVSFFILFMHQDYKFKKRYLPALYKMMKQGNINPEEYALIVDRTYLEKNSSVYGIIQQKQIDFPININKNRKAIGLNGFNYEQWRDSLINPQFHKKKIVITKKSKSKFNVSWK